MFPKIQQWLQRKKVQMILPFGVLVVLILLPFYQVLFFDRTITAGSITDGVTGTVASDNFQNVADDQIKHMIDRGGSAWQDEPLTLAVHESYRNGEKPVWNANAGFGKPLGADMMSVAYSVMRIPLYIYPSIAVFDFVLLFRIVVGGLLMYLFLRNRGIHTLAAGVGSVSFILSGYFFYYVNMGHLNVEVLMPGLFLAIDRLVERRKLFDFLLLTAVVFLMITGGHPESMIIICLFASAYFLYRVWSSVPKNKIKNQKDSFVAFRTYATLPVVLYTIAFVSAVGLTGFLMVPFYEYYLQGHIGVHDPKHGLYNVVLHPAILALQFFPEYIQNAVDSQVYNYFSVTALFLIPLAFITKGYRSLALFFFSALLVFIAKVYGFIWFGWLAYIPILNNFVYYKYLQSETSFAVAVLTAIALHGLLIQGLRIKHFLVAITVVLATFFYFSTTNSNISLSQRPFLFEAYLILIIGVFSGFLVYSFLKEKQKWPWMPSVGVFVAAVVVLEVLAAAPKMRPPRIDPYVQAPYLSYLMQQEKPFRVFSPDDILYPATSSIFDIDDIRDVHAVVPELYWNYIHTFIDPTIVDRFSEITEETKYRDNPFFDLTNTTYIVTKKPIEQLPQTHLIWQIDSNNPDALGVAPDWFTLNGETRPVLFAHPPAAISYTITPTSDSSYLTGYVGMPPDVWNADFGDGVRFRIELSTDETTQEAFNLYLDPKQNPRDREWKPFSVSLEDFIDVPVTINLYTEANMSDSYDWAGWADLQFSASQIPQSFLTDTPSRQFELVYSNDFFIYRNKTALERAFAVPEVTFVSSEEDARKEMLTPGFNPRQETVFVAKSSPSLDCGRYSNVQVQVEERTNKKVRVTIDSDGCGALVVSDLYYPGWKVYQNGKETELYQANYAFRGVIFEEGTTTVEFRYESFTVNLGVAVSLFSGFGFIFGLWFYRKKKSQNSP